MAQSRTESVKAELEVQWAVRWVGEDLWWEGFVEQVSFKSGMEAWFYLVEWTDAAKRLPHMTVVGVSNEQKFLHVKMQNFAAVKVFVLTLYIL